MVYGYGVAVENLLLTAAASLLHPETDAPTGNDAARSVLSDYLGRLNSARFNSHKSSVNAADNTRREMLDGKEYLVLPAVPIKEGVLNGYFVPTHEIALSLPSWNGRPVTIDHPTDDNDMYVMANSPDVWGKSAVGWFFLAQLKGGGMHGEFWLDIAKLKALRPDVLTRLSNGGGVMEVSTGYFSDIEWKQGKYNGISYEGIHRNILPDHIALLPGEIGACSVKDGCGVPRTNRRTNMADVAKENKGKEPEKAKTPETPVVNEQNPETPAIETPSQSAAAGAKEEGDLAALATELAAIKTVFAEFGGVDGIKGLLSTVKATNQQQRQTVIDRLVANAACAFTKADLEKFSMQQLDLLERSLRPADYRGRAVSNAQGEPEWEAYVPPALEVKKKE